MTGGCDLDLAAPQTAGCPKTEPRAWPPPAAKELSEDRITTLAYICFPPASRQIEIEGDSELIEGPHVFPESFPRELP